MIDNLIFASYGALITIASITVSLYFTYLKTRWIGWKSFKDPFFEVAVGVLGIAFSTLVIRVWFQGWKSGVILDVDTTWMLDHVTVVGIIILPCLCYTWHIRTITRKRYGEKIWVMAFTTSVAAFVTTFWFSLNHEWASYLISAYLLR